MLKKAFCSCLVFFYCWFKLVCSKGTHSGEKLFSRFELTEVQCYSNVSRQAFENFSNFPYRIWYFCKKPEFSKVAVAKKERVLTKQSKYRRRTFLRRKAIEERGSQLVNSTSNCSTNYENTPENLLSILKGKSVGIYGDSLSRQLFNGIIGSNLHLSTSYEKVNMTYFIHRYQTYNTSISYCEDGTGEMALMMADHEHFHTTLQRMLDSVDYLIIGIAAWYKPGFQVTNEQEPNYYKNFLQSQVLYAGEMDRIRRNIMNYYNSCKSKRTPPRIIWRLSPHAGNIDEMNFLYPNLSKSFDHWNGHFWSYNYSQNSAGWVLIYNEIIQSIADTYGDTIFDWYSLSMRYLNFTVGRELVKEIHYDSLHYCLEGFPLISNTMISELFAELSKS